MARNRRRNRRLLQTLSQTLFAGLLLAVAPRGASQHHPHPPEAEPGDAGRQQADGEHHPGGAAEGHGLHHDFSNAEHWTAVFDSEERREWQKPDEVVALMDVEPGMTVADLGAGTGFFEGYLAAAVGSEGRVLALEPEASLVAFMTERGEKQGWTNVEPRQIPYDDPGVAEGSVDRFLIVNTWHHIDARGSYAAKLRRALKPGGAVVVVDFTMDSPSGPPKEHRLPPEQIIEELQAGGLAARQIDEDLPRQFIVVGSRDAGGD
jgi:cyclopropane fatty-acyl-phospholipid synthase-like methyltransferase